MEIWRYGMNLPEVPRPWKSDGEGSFIFDADGNMIAEIRGWGHLSTKFDEDQAEQIQKDISELIVNAVNKMEETK